MELSNISFNKLILMHWIKNNLFKMLIITKTKINVYFLIYDFY